MITRVVPGHSIDEKIERSSLGEPEAKKLRALTPRVVATQIVEKSVERGGRKSRGSRAAKP